MSEPVLFSYAFWQRASVFLASLTVLLGSIGLCGWVFDSFTLRSFLSAGATMKVNTALLLIAGGFLLIVVKHVKGPAVIWLGSLAALFCIAIITEHVGRLNLRIDEFWYQDRDTNPLRESPGRTSALTAATLLFLIAAMLSVKLKQFHISQLICGVVFILIYAALLGHIFHSAAFYRQGHYSGVALHTALGLLFLNLGILSAQSSQGWLQIFFNDKKGRYTTIYVLCYLLCIAPLLISLYLFMSANNVFSPLSGIIIMVIISAIISIPVAYLILNRIVLTDSNLKKTNQRLELALDAAKLGSFEMNIVTGEIDCNAQCKINLGLQPDAVFNRHILLELIMPEYHQYWKTQLNHAISSNSIYYVEYQARWPDESVHWIKSYGRVQYNTAGNATSLVGVCSNITTQKEADLRKNDFIGVVSHELKTPLTSLKAFTQVLHSRAKKENREFETGALSKIEQQINKMSAMINGFLNVSRLESGKMYLNKATFLINDLINDIAEESRIMQVSHEITVVHCPDITVTADRDKVGQVINNLISNAIKYSDRGTEIFVTCSLHEGFLQISVRDQGMGISKQYLSKLFDRYYRVDNPNTKHISGFGIGLYLSAEIVKRHEGRIWAESEQGHGSEFIFTLPV